MSNTTTIIVAALSGGGLFAVIGAVINGLFTKRRLGAEATQIITQAATGVVSDLRKSLEDAGTERERIKAEHLAAMERMQRDHEAAIAKLVGEQEAEREEWRQVLQLHIAWDYIAIEKLRHLDVTLPPPPPILPPNR